MSTAFHLETDSSSECSNKTAIEALHHYIDTRQNDRSEHLIHIEMAMTNSINATTGNSLMELLYGTHFQLFPHPADASSAIPAVTHFFEKINESVQLAKDRHVIAKTRQATQANRWCRSESNYRVGDLVYLNIGNLHLKIKRQSRSPKFFPQFIGPFPILEVRPETSSYKLDVPTIYQIHLVFHAKLLKPAIPNNSEWFPIREPPRLGPVFQNNDGNSDNYKVKYICDHQDIAQGWKYYIHWKGWPLSNDEWIYKNDMNSLNLIAKYLSSIPTRTLMQWTRGRRGARAEQDSITPRVTPVIP